MKKNDKIIVLLGVIILVLASIGIYYYEPIDEREKIDSFKSLYPVESIYAKNASAITTCTSNPFFPLIATPLAVQYDDENNQNVKPLYVINFLETSNTIERAVRQIGILPDLRIAVDSGYGDNAKDISLAIAKEYWDRSEAALVIEDSQEGYNLGVVAAPIASYLGIPIIITNEIDSSVNDVLNDLGVKTRIICGNLSSFGNDFVFETVDEIIDETIALLKEKFGKVDYITIANPLDISKAQVLDTKKEETFEGTLSTTSFTASGIAGILGGAIRGIPFQAWHVFEVPDDYKYAKIKITAKNLIDENVDETGSQLQPMLIGPDNEQIAFIFTVGGIPERDNDGNIIEDKIEFETIMYDKPGEYALMVSGKYLTKKFADYEIDVTIEKLDTAIDPNMLQLSSISPYLTAYHKGIILAKPEFAFVADEKILDDPAPGVAFPAANPDLIDDVNAHVFGIHEELNDVLVKIHGADLEIDENNDLKILRDYFDESPVYIAIVGDARMVPQYYYYDTPDAVTIKYGWDVASDFIYGNIDPIHRNDEREGIFPKDVFESPIFDEYYPHQENIVGRITGWDVQDASALIARTIFYNLVLDNMDNADWKDNAVVQTGSGTEFQRIPLIDIWRRIVGGMFGMHDLGIKWPTGEAHFENNIIANALFPGRFTIRQTENTESMRKGLSETTLKEIKTMGLLNLMLFPKVRATQIVGELSRIYNIKGEEDITNSNYIFTFGHGQPMGYQHGDVQTDSIGFRPVILQNLINRISVILPAALGTVLSTGLGNAGGYYVRFVENMELGPSVMFVESCYIGRYDGFPAKNLVSQAYIHAGVNAFIASSRGSPGPGYLDARKRPVGFGLAEYIKTLRNPDLQEPHFSALLAVNIYDDLIHKNTDVGTAFRNSRNQFMEDADTEFFWTPPLSLDIQTTQDLEMYQNSMSSSSEDMRCMEKKFTCQLEYNLLGDPAFNPYEPVNEGRK
jgi:hypothetical protein